MSKKMSVAEANAVWKKTLSLWKNEKFVKEKEEISMEDGFIGFVTCDECKTNASVPLMAHEEYEEYREACLCCGAFAAHEDDDE